MLVVLFYIIVILISVICAQQFLCILNILSFMFSLGHYLAIDVFVVLFLLFCSVLMVLLAQQILNFFNERPVTIWDFNKNDHSAHSSILKNIYIRDDRPVFWQAVGINKLIIGKQIASLPNLHILLLHHEYSLKFGYINQANILHCLQVIVAYQMRALQIIFKAFAYLPIIGILFSLIANFIASIAIYIAKILTHMLNQYVLQRQQDVDKILLQQGQKTLLIQAIQSLLNLQIQDNLGRRLQNIEKYSRIN